MENNSEDWDYISIDRQDFKEDINLYDTLLTLIISKSKNPKFKGNLPSSFQLYPLYEKDFTFLSTFPVKDKKEFTTTLQSRRDTKDEYKWNIQE